MGLKKTRVILSVILTLLIALSTAVVAFSLVANATLASQSYIIKHFATDEMAEECEKQLSAKYAVLEQETGIPQRVFESYKNDISTKESISLAVKNAFTTGDSALYSEERIDYFYSKCTEYLDAKGIEYDEENVRLAADRGAKIFSDCVGVHNLSGLESTVAQYSRTLGGICSVALFLLVACVIMLAVLYQNRHIMHSYLAAGLIGGGLSAVLTSALCLVKKVSLGLNYSPSVYQSSFAAMVNKYFVLVLAVSLAICVAGVVMQCFAFKNADNKGKRKFGLDNILGKY